MSFFQKRCKVVTHSGNFHADDVCAVAVLDLLHDGNIEIIRSRQESDWAGADVILDVGGTYDSARVFDHHQPGGAGARPNTIPYASFGLIWKHFGKALIARIVRERVGEGWGSPADTKGIEIANEALIEKVYETFDRHFVQFVDAIDTGTTVVKPSLPEVRGTGYGISDIVAIFNATWREDATPIAADRGFLEAEIIIKKILLRALLTTVDDECAITDIIAEHHRTKASGLYDARLVVIERGIYSGEAVRKAIGADISLLFTIKKSKQGTWYVEAIRASDHGFELRKSLPKAWAGLQDDMMAEVSGVKDAIFCHTARFLAVANSFDGAIALAKKALEDK